MYFTQRRVRRSFSTERVRLGGVLSRGSFRGEEYSHLNILGKRTMYLRQEGLRQEEYFIPGKVREILFTGRVKIGEVCYTERVLVGGILLTGRGSSRRST